MHDKLIQNNSLLTEMLTKHGPWGLGCTLLAFAFWVFALQPLSRDREMLMETLTSSVEHNEETMQVIADSTQRMANLAEMQESTLIRLTDSIDRSTELGVSTKLVLDTFADTMLKTHPDQHQKLDRILNNLDRR